MRRDPARLLSIVGPLIGLVAAIAIWSSAPPRVEAVPSPLVAATPPPETVVWRERPALTLPSPPVVTTAEHVDLELPAGWSASSLRVDGLPATHFGVNPLHLVGRDPNGQPVDMAWPLIVAEYDDGAWIEDGIAAYLSAAGFDDDDDLADDLAHLAEAQLPRALAAFDGVGAGPVMIHGVRPGPEGVDVTLRPVQGGVAGTVTLDGLLVDVEAEVFGSQLRAEIALHRVWFDFSLAVSADDQGRPVVQVGEMDPNLDLVADGDGVGNSILEVAAWVPARVVELLAEQPIRDAIVEGLAALLDGWVDRFSFTTQAPLNPVEVEVSYRFGFVGLHDEGMLVSLDFRADCAEARPAMRRLVRPQHVESASLIRPSDGESQLQLVLTDRAVNGALHALWQCGALDAQIAFEEATAQAPYLVPQTITTAFLLPPLLPASPTADRETTMQIGVGPVEVATRYHDARYELRAVGRLPIRLERAPDGHALEIAFAAASDDLDLYTDCLRVDGRPCRDNPLFDRMAWFAVPLLPPIGATVPIPDLSLPGESGDLGFTLGELTFDAEAGALHAFGRWQVN